MADNCQFESWGRFPKLSHLGELHPYFMEQVGPAIKSVDSLILPRGKGRSYGDSCLNDGGYLLSTRHLDKLLDFNPDSGLLKCEAGVTLDEILKVFVPKGWFLPVIPGTKFVTIGGAIANDVHGKNHHKTGSFGNHVRSFELERSDGTRMVCSDDTNREWFMATIGGLGLTGVILWAEIKLISVKGPYIDMESIKFDDLDEFLRLSEESDTDYEYSVSWLDCLGGKGKVRGIFMRGNHSDRVEADRSKLIHKDTHLLNFPFDAPSILLSKPTIKMFNMLYYNKQRNKHAKNNVHYDSFFFPLDRIKNWNRMYGRRGFLQWQCAVTEADDNYAIRAILDKITASGLGSFLVVLKEFGKVPPIGMLSFPMPGITLALDFANIGKRLFSLLDELDEIVIKYDGRLYPAKDARMSSKTFKSSFSALNNYKKFIDPRFSSSFYRRVGRD